MTDSARTRGLVPVGAVGHKKSGNSYVVRANEALICKVSGDASHKAVSRVIAKDPVHDDRPYSDMHMIP